MKIRIKKTYNPTPGSIPTFTFRCAGDLPLQITPFMLTTHTEVVDMDIQGIKKADYSEYGFDNIFTVYFNSGNTMGCVRLDSELQKILPHLNPA